MQWGGRWRRHACVLLRRRGCCWQHARLNLRSSTVQPAACRSSAALGAHPLRGCKSTLTFSPLLSIPTVGKRPPRGTTMSFRPMSFPFLVKNTCENTKMQLWFHFLYLNEFHREKKHHQWKHHFKTTCQRELTNYHHNRWYCGVCPLKGKKSQCLQNMSPLNQWLIKHHPAVLKGTSRAFSKLRPTASFQVWEQTGTH